MSEHPDQSDEGCGYRYLNDAELHARVTVICKAMGWIAPRSGGQPNVKGVYDAIKIVDALAAWEASRS
jgi:hypothetical protein